MNNENEMSKEEMDAMDARIEDILADAKDNKLTKDSIAMIICLQKKIYDLEIEIDLADSLVRMIKNHELFATYEGNRTIPYDLDQFKVTLANYKKGVNNENGSTNPYN